MSQNAGSLVLEGVCVPSHKVPVKNGIGVSCKKKKRKAQNLYCIGNY